MNTKHKGCGIFSPHFFYLILICMFFLCFPSLSHSQEIINPRSGKLFLKTTDLAVKAGPISLRVTRTFQTGKGKPGLLGRRWLLNWESTLSRAADMVFVEDAERPALFRKEKGKDTFKSRFGDRVVLKKDGRAVRKSRDGAQAVYDAKGLLVEKQDANGNKITLRYDKKGRLTRVEGPRNTFLKFETDKKGQVTRIEASTGAEVEYEYSKGNLEEVEVNDGPATEYSYDKKGALVRIERPMTGKVELAYDDKGRVTRRCWADGSEEFYEYADTTRSVRHISPSGAITSIKRAKDGKREEITDTLGNKTVVEYDKNSRPIVITGPTGDTSRMNYDAEGRLKEVKGCCGIGARFEYLGNTSLYKSVTRTNGARQDFTYDDKGNLLIIKEGKDVIFDAAYYPGGLVKSYKGLNIPERRFTYFPNGLTKSQTDAMGHTTTYEYDKRGNRIEETDSSGGVTKQTYDKQNRLKRLTDPAGRTWGYDYDREGRGVKVTGPTGDIFRYDYDKRGRLLLMTDPAGRETRYQYNPDDRISKVIYPGGAEHKYVYDAAGKMVKEINPLGGVTHRTYNLRGQLVSQSDPMGLKWRQKYSRSGAMTQVVGPGGGITSYSYDAKGRPKETVDPAGRRTRYEYDGKARSTKAVFPGGVVHTYAYAKSGKLSRRGDNWGADIEYEYDALGRLIKERMATGLEISYRYNALGDLLEWRDNLGAGVNYKYNAQRLIFARQDTTGASTKYNYDLSGRPLEEINPLGHVVQNFYTRGGDLAEVKLPSGDFTRYTYGPSGALSEVRHPGDGVTRFRYDPMGNRTEVTTPLGSKTRSTYDKAGRLVSFTDARGRTTSFSYDAAGRLAKKSFARGKVVSYTYNAAGNLVKVDDGAFPVRYAYDKAGRRIRIEYPAIKRVLKYQYDKRGRLAGFIDSEGHKLSYQYDKYGRLTAIKLPKGDMKFSHNARSRLTSITYPNRVKAAYEYDKMGRPVKLTHLDRAGNSIMGWTYTYDSAGNPVKVADSGGRETIYRYNSAGRLVEETGPYGTIQYSYLLKGNRRKLESKEKSVRYQYDETGDLLKKAGNEDFLYDANGNLTERRGPKGTTRYTYNAENRLVRVTEPDGKEVSFGYAPTGERIWRKDKTGHTWFVTDGVNLLAELDESLKPKASYLQGPGIDRPLMLSKDGKSYFYLPDLLGSIAALTDSTGKVSASYRTDAFGNLLDQKGTIQNPFIFTGREYEPDLGLYYYRARFYDPALGRFMSVDPKWTPAKLNKYAYALNAPTRYRDPLGLSDDDLLRSFGLTRETFRQRLVLPDVKRLKLMGWKSQAGYTNEYFAENVLLASMKRIPENLRGSRMVNILRNNIARSMRNLRSYHRLPEQIRMSQADAAWARLQALPGPSSSGPSSPAGSPPKGQIQHNINYQSQPGGQALPHEGVVDIGPPPRQGLSVGGNQTVRMPAQGPRPPSPLTEGHASVQSPSRLEGFTDLNRPLTSHEMGGLGLLGALHAYEYWQNWWDSDRSFSDGATDFVKGIAIGTVAGGLGVLAIGATPMAVAGLGLSIASHATSPFEFMDEWDKWEEALENEELADHQRDQFLQGNMERAVTSMQGRIRAEMDPLLADMKNSCDKALTAADKAERLGNEAKALLPEAGTDPLSSFEAALGECDKIPGLRTEIKGLRDKAETLAEKVKSDLAELEGKAAKCSSEGEARQIREGYEACKGHVRRLAKIAAEAKGKKREIDALKAEARRLKQALSSAVSAKLAIINKADQAVQAKTTFESQAARFNELNNNLTAKRAEWLGKINGLEATFAEADKGAAKTAFLKKIQGTKKMVNAYEMSCDLEGAKTVLDAGVEKAVNARLDAEGKVTSDFEGYSAVLSECAGKSVDDLMRAIADASARAQQALAQHADLPQKADRCANGEGTQVAEADVDDEGGGFSSEGRDEKSDDDDDSGFGDEEDENVSDDGSSGDSSDSGFSDEPHTIGGETQSPAEDPPQEPDGFSDEFDDIAPDANTETVTYFDRNFMPQSWKTSGNSQQVRVHVFSLGSRLGWSAALARHCGPNAIDLIIDHLNGASVHVKGAHDSSYMPVKAYKDWQQTQKKHQYWIQKLQQRPNIQGRERQLKTLSGSFKSHALGLAKKIAFQSVGNGLEQRENCDSYYLRIGYYLAYSSQSLAYAAQGQAKGMPKKWVRNLMKAGQSAAASAAQYMRDLKKLKLATGFCIDLSSIASRVYQGTRGGKALPGMAKAAQKGWQDSFEALGGLSSGSPDMEKIGRYVFADMKRFLPRGLEKISQRAYEANDKVDLPVRYRFEYNKAFKLGSVTDHNPGFWVRLSYKESANSKSKFKCKPRGSNKKILKNGQFEKHGGKGLYCLVDSYFKESTYLSGLLWISGDWSILMSGWDYPFHPGTMFGPRDNIIKYMVTVLDNLVPRLRKAIEMYGTSGKKEGDEPLPIQNSPSKDSGSNDGKGINLLNLEVN